VDTVRPVGPYALIVDDCPNAAGSLALLLRRWGLRTAVAYDGPTALDLASVGPPAAALLDIEMPDMDGCEPAGRLRRLPGMGRALLIAVSGRGREEDVRRHCPQGPKERPPLNGLSLGTCPAAPNPTQDDNDSFLWPAG
jgi:CheY-like chemotaxis protein